MIPLICQTQQFIEKKPLLKPLVHNDRDRILVIFVLMIITGYVFYNVIKYLRQC